MSTTISAPMPPAEALLHSDNAPSNLIQRKPVATTTSTSFEYVEACARSNQTASLNEPLTLLFQAEKLPPVANEPKFSLAEVTSRAACDVLWKRLSKLSSTAIERMIYDSSISRISAKCEYDGAYIAEAGTFAAVTCWDPMYAPEPPPGWESMCGPDAPDWDLSEMLDKLISNGVPMSQIVKERPVFGEFWMKMELAKYRYLYPLIWRRAQSRKAAATASGTEAADSDIDKKQLKYWYICLTSRNPAIQPPVPGAVRAVIEPITKRYIEEEDIPAVFICAGGERARDVYGYFGFRVVQEIDVGTDRNGKSIKTWCMMYTNDG